MISHIRPQLRVGAKNVYNQSIVVYPNGESVYRRALPKQSKTKDSRSYKELLAAERRRQLSTEKIAIATDKFIPKISSSHTDDNFQPYHRWFEDTFNQAAPKSKLKPGWGLLPEKFKKFTRESQRTLRYGAAAMELKLGKERCKFVTLTVPGSTPEAIKVIAQYSGWIINRIQTWLTDNFIHSDGKKYMIGVWELQKRGMLHLHFLVGLESFFYYEKLAVGIEMLWYELLCQLSKISRTNLFKKDNGHNWQPQWRKIKHRAVRVEHVNKSVANYLSKYMGKSPSKNLEAIQYKGKKVLVYSPSRWWTCSRDVNVAIAEYTVRYELHPTKSSMVKEIHEFIKDVFNSFGFWTVEIINPYSKEKVGVLARGKYEDVKEACEVLQGIINEVCTECRQDVDRNYKLYHSADFGYTKRLNESLQEQQFIEYLDAEGTPYFMRRKSQYKTHRQYWEALKRGETMQEAFRYCGMS